VPAQLQLHSFVELWHPWVFAWVLLVQVAYLLAVGPMREGYNWGEPATRAQKTYFSVGLWLIYLAEGTPMHILSESYLFSFHMIQHIILTSITPPLILLGTPGWLFRPLIAWRPLYHLIRFFSRPLLALVMFNLIYSVWHMPLAYQATLWWHWFHMIQHGVLVAFSFFLWMPILSPVREVPRLGYGGQMLFIFLTALMQIVVFGIITFSDSVLYEFYAKAPRIWAILDAHSDQQLAGVIMKMGGMAIAVIAWTLIFFQWAARDGAMWDKSGSLKAPTES